MEKRTLLYVRSVSAAQAAVPAPLLPDWELRALSFEQALRGAVAAMPVALVLVDSPDALPRLEALLAAAPHTEWVVLAPPRLLEDTMLRQLIRVGCFDYHTLPIDPVRLRITLGHAFGMATLQSAEREDDARAAGSMVAGGEAMRRLRRQIAKVAKTGAPVLIQGESGTGKELAAKAVHRGSPRADGPFVAVNCGALPATLIQSELFGHEKGAFTGANQRKIGRVEAAAGGTIFLDEIGDLPLELQVNLLRFLQEGTIERVGGNEPIAVDVRVIAATHVDLEDAVRRQRFRADLYYRLNVLRLEVPPLRQRGGDVELLARHFFERFAAERNPVVRGFSRSALEAMRRHDWPGNVRELINRIRRAMVMCDCRLIGPADLGLDCTPLRLPTLAEAREAAERAAVEQALARTGGNISQAAAQLGVTRVTLYRMLEKLGLDSRGETREPPSAVDVARSYARAGLAAPV